MSDDFTVLKASSAEDCHRLLPVNLIADEYTIDRFALLQRYGNGREDPVAMVLPRDLVMLGIDSYLARSDPEITVLEMKGGVPLLDEWRERSAPVVSSTERLAPIVEVDDLDRLLATRSLTVQGHVAKVTFDRSTVRQLLLKEQAVVPVRVGDRFELVTLVARGASTAERTEVGAEDLAELLGANADSGLSAQKAAWNLSPRNVAELRSSGTTQVSIAGTAAVRKLTVRSTRASMAPEDGAGGGDKGERDPAPSALMATKSLVSTFELALYLPFRQRWELLGYSRGGLLNSLSLAPQEETTIELFTWDRRKRSTEESSSSDFESSTDGSRTIKDSADVLHETTRDSDFHAQADGRLTVASVGLSIGGSVDTKTSVKDVCKKTTGHIDESIVKATSKVKLSRQTKVSETIEVGREQRVTRKIHNVNMCRTLNLDYFEVIANHRVETKVDVGGVRLCVLMRNPVTLTIDRALLRHQEHVLRPALLAPSLAVGFDSARLLEARSRMCAICCEQCSCGPHTEGTDSGTIWLDVVASLQAMVVPLALVMHSDPEQFYENIHLRYSQAINQNLRLGFERWLYMEAVSEQAPQFRRILFRLSQDVNLTRDKAFAEEMWQQAQILPTDFLDTAGLFKTLKDEVFHQIVQPSVGAWVYNTHQTGLYVYSDVQNEIWWHWYTHFEDEGVGAGTVRFIAAYKQYKDSLSAAAKQQEGAAAAAEKRDTDATDQVASAYPPKDVAEALEREEVLLTHIRENEAYYRFVIWRSLEPSVRWRMITPPNASSEFERLVEREAVGFVDNRLAFPLDAEGSPGVKHWLDTNVLHNAELAGITASRTVSLPTPGVSVETRLGACDGCEEFIQEQRRADMRLKGAQADAAAATAAQEQQEAKRYEARLISHPPLLDNPTRCDPQLRIQVEQAPPKPHGRFKIVKGARGGVA